MPKESVENGKLIRSSGVVSFLTMVSRVFGLLRDVVIANVFGSGAGADTCFLGVDFLAPFLALDPEFLDEGIL